MKVFIKKYLGFMLMFMIILLLPFNWYASIFLTEELIYPLYKGAEIMMKDNFHYLIVYLLCLIIQCLAMNDPRHAPFGAISQLIFLGMLFLCPLTLYEWSLNVLLWEYDFNLLIIFTEYIIPSLDIGFYGVLLLSILVFIYDLKIFFSMGSKRNTDNVGE